ncbi:hypothetical protein MNBD_GAMMA06-537 [hydrothermal vent metagenome]|uniref:Uncharacterized protein n=1 Tax=hydrothermal vent metagenome TaxID=652676 RepID=A0A3B0WF92_9ZZZZ
MKNIFEPLPKNLDDEIVESLIQNKDIKIDSAVPLIFNMVSTNHCYAYSKPFNYNPRHELPGTDWLDQKTE